MPTKTFFYAVRVGRVPGVYPTWDACQEQVLGFSCARFKKFEQIEDALTFVNQPPSPRLSKPSTRVRPVVESVQTSNQNYSANVEATGSEDPEVGKGGVKQAHVEKKVTKKRKHGDGESHEPILEIDEEGTTALNDPGTTRDRPAKKSRRPKPHSRTTGPLALFFAQYMNFEYNPAGSATDEFYRLCDLRDWDKNDPQKEIAKQGFQDALTLQFNNSYGTDVDDLTKWQALCAKLGVDPIPESLYACRETVRNTHVNLVDLVDVFGTGGKAHVFPTVVALSEYTMEHGKFFPKDNAHAGNLLKFLLRQIINPELSRNEGRRGGRGGRRA